MANRDSASTSSLHLYSGLVIDFFCCPQGEDMANIEPTAGTINDICTFGGSGLMLLALDCSQIPSYFLPALGPAPKWCSYLENLTVCFHMLFDSFTALGQSHLRS
jgi:hypothetical protein